MNPREFCRQEVAPAHSETAIALHGTDNDTELALLGILAFHRRVCDIPHRASEPALADMQLQWWRKQLTPAAPSTHPSLQALDGLRHSCPTTDATLHALLDSVAADIDFTGFADQAELDHFLRTRGAALAALLSTALQTQLPVECAENIGAFLEYCLLLQDLPRHARAGVCYFPLKELATFNITADRYCSDTGLELAPFLHTQTHHYLEPLRASLATLSGPRQRQLKPLLTLLALRKSWLAATEADGYLLHRYHLQLGALRCQQIRLSTNLKVALGRFHL